MEVICLDDLQQSVNQALKYIKLIIENLEKAEKLSVADIAGGMMIISKNKYNAIDKANSYEEKFEEWYKRLIRVPSYQKIDLNLRVEIEKSVKIVDIFFDNLPVDIYVQTKIGSVLKEAEAIQEKLQEVKNSIRNAKN